CNALKTFQTQFSGLPWGKHPYLRCSRQNRVQRVLAVRVTRPYTTRPTPRSFPFRTDIATDAPNSGDRTSYHFAVFVPQPFRVID
ncbi:hypothetical protein O6323_23930, partial [Salmonella enterica subsp. enterica]